MTFTSLSFLCFFPAVCLLWYILPGGWRRPFLLAANYYFYFCAGPGFLLLLAGVTLFCWGGTLLLAPLRDGRRAGLGRGFMTVVCLSPLFLFKYLPFFTALAGRLLSPLGIAVPAGLSMPAVLGLSFYTLQALGYTLDFWAGRREAEKSLLNFALFVSFFPFLVSGPIARGDSLLPQLAAPRPFSFDNAADGLVQMLWGYVKKMVIGDGLAYFVNLVWTAPGDLPPAASFIALLLYSVQIYCDFSGYSDIALGAARVLGIGAPANFTQPYFAASVGEFWRRWHISLSSWFRDYLYIPMGGSRAGVLRLYRNLLVVFLVSGLWHGAAATYVVWGAVHGILQVAGRLTAPVRKALYSRLPDPLSALGHGLARVWTFCLVTLAWVPFRAPSLGEAGAFLVRSRQGLLSLFQGGNALSGALSALSFAQKNGWALLACVGLLLVFDIWEARTGTNAGAALRRSPAWVRWPVYYALVLLLLFFGNFGASSFIYMQY